MSLLKPTPQVCSWTQALDNPRSLATYVAHGGYQALRRVITTTSGLAYRRSRPIARA